MVLFEDCLRYYELPWQHIEMYAEDRWKVQRRCPVLLQNSKDSFLAVGCHLFVASLARTEVVVLSGMSAQQRVLSKCLGGSFLLLIRTGKAEFSQPLWPWPITTYCEAERVWAQCITGR